MDTLLQYLTASSGVGMWVLVLMAWRFDRRLTRIEYKVFGFGESENV